MPSSSKRIEVGVVLAILIVSILLALTGFRRLTERYADIVGAFVAVLTFFATGFGIFQGYKTERESRAAAEKRIEQIEVQAAEEPEKTKFAWNLASKKLEAYFDRNLSQVRMIFLVAVGVMVVGFSFVLWGVMLAISNPASTRTSYVAAVSGIVTQFIGVTFMVIYRSTMAQANQFMEVLERINTVGMAVQIFDSIPEAEAQLKNSTRAEIVALLLSSKVKPGSGTRRG